MTVDGEDLLLRTDHRLVRAAHHQLLGGPVDVGVEQAHGEAQPAQRQRQVGGHRGFADTALARRDGDLGAHPGKQVARCLFRGRRPAARAPCSPAVTSRTPGSSDSTRRASRSTTSPASGLAVVITISTATLPSLTTTDRTNPKETMSRDRPGNLTFVSAPLTSASVIATRPPSRPPEVSPDGLGGHLRVPRRIPDDLHGHVLCARCVFDRRLGRPPRSGAPADSHVW